MPLQDLALDAPAQLAEPPPPPPAATAAAAGVFQVGPQVLQPSAAVPGKPVHPSVAALRCRPGADLSRSAPTSPHAASSGANGSSIGGAPASSSPARSTRIMVSSLVLLGPGV